MSDSSISFKWEECISNLEFIYSIPKGHKPYYNTKSTISINSWFTTVRRRWSGEKGEYGIFHVKKVLGSCDNHYRMCLKQLENCNSDEDIMDITLDMQQLHTALTNSLEGFCNLLLTYKDQGDVLDNYTLCKNKVIDLITLIEEYFIEEEKKEQKKLEEQEMKDQRNYYDYFTTGWGVPFKITEKKPMLVSLVSMNKPKSSFFSTNNMILLKTKYDEKLN